MSKLYVGLVSDVELIHKIIWFLRKRGWQKSEISVLVDQRFIIKDMLKDF